MRVMEALKIDPDYRLGWGKGLVNGSGRYAMIGIIQGDVPN
jgi:hypothetical protein